MSASLSAKLTAILDFALTSQIARSPFVPGVRAIYRYPLQLPSSIDCPKVGGKVEGCSSVRREWEQAARRDRSRNFTVHAMAIGIA